MIDTKTDGFGTGIVSGDFTAKPLKSSTQKGENGILLAMLSFEWYHFRPFCYYVGITLDFCFEKSELFSKIFLPTGKQSPLFHTLINENSGTIFQKSAIFV